MLLKQPKDMRFFDFFIILHQHDAHAYFERTLSVFSILIATWSNLTCKLFISRQLLSLFCLKTLNFAYIIFKRKFLILHDLNCSILYKCCKLRFN